MPNSTVRVVGRFIVRPDRIDTFRMLGTSLLEPTRRENGCLRYELLQNAEDFTDFTFVEEWASNAALDAHFTMPHVADALAKLEDIRAAPPDIRRYKTLA